VHMITSFFTEMHMITVDTGGPLNTKYHSVKTTMKMMVQHAAYEECNCSYKSIVSLRNTPELRLEISIYYNYS
jgi:hypothetical protein